MCHSRNLTYFYSNLHDPDRPVCHSPLVTLSAARPGEVASQVGSATATPSAWHRGRTAELLGLLWLSRSQRSCWAVRHDGRTDMHLCGAQHDVYEWRCTLDAGHTGPHIATVGPATPQAAILGAWGTMGGDASCPDCSALSRAIHGPATELERDNHGEPSSS